MKMFFLLSYHEISPPPPTHIPFSLLLKPAPLYFELSAIENFFHF